MKQVYQILGMSCQHCVQKVQRALVSHPEVANAEVSQSPPVATLTLKTPVGTEELQGLLDKAGPYKIVNHSVV